MWCLGIWFSARLGSVRLTVGPDNLSDSMKMHWQKAVMPRKQQLIVTNASLGS